MRHVARDTVIDGRYQVLDHLGTGGMAEVYCATDLQLGRKVALKLLHDRFAEDEAFVERFRREASSAAGLQHQHVVAVYDRGEWDGTSYIAMEYVDGRTLKQIVHGTDQATPLDPATAVDLTVQILRAARFAHRRGVIHRDLKPHNVIVDDEGRAKVTDFGIARAGASDMTETGSILGTAQYLSPEQAQGHAVSARSDLYSVGVVLYELLTGRVPFEADSAVSIALKHVNEAPVPPSRLNPEVTPELEAVVLRALEKDPAARFADADEFIAALEAAASRIPMAAAAAVAAAAASPPPPSSPPTGVYPAPIAYEHEQERVYVPPAPRRRRRWPWALLAALVLAAAAVGTVLALGAGDTKAVPDVVGSSISVAQQRLENEGFRPTIVRDTSDKPRNTVIGQNPGGGETVDEGAQVTLTVSDGPAITTVPHVVGEGRRAARRALTRAGFDVEERAQFSDDVRVNRVIEQTPSGRSQAEQGSTVTLVVSRGPERVDVPDVAGDTEDEARTTLESAGFRVSARKQESDSEDPGTVLAQNPGPDGRAPRGSVVTITVAEEPRQVAVPDVVGRSQNRATALLSGRGFEVDVEETPVDTVSEDGIVQDQAPAGDRDADRGSAVTITVGRFNPDLNPDPQPGTPAPAPPAPPPPAVP